MPRWALKKHTPPPSLGGIPMHTMQSDMDHFFIFKFFFPFIVGLLLLLFIQLQNVINNKK
jgi:hypothetical protein